MADDKDLPVVRLVDRSAELAGAWRQVFRDHHEVEVAQGDFFERDADALVSPANSFGIMDGGLDLAIRDVLGLAVEREVQGAIAREHHGEIPVGVALVVATQHFRWPWLICAPTMRIPEDVSRTLNAYLAFRAVLLAVRRHNATAARPIRSLVCPGLGTGVGGMPSRRCAAQMRVAYRQVLGPGSLPSFAEIHKVHGAMHSAE